MNYLSYPTKKNTKSRMSRKQGRNKVFLANKTARRKLDREKRANREIQN